MHIALAENDVSDAKLIHSLIEQHSNIQRKRWHNYNNRNCCPIKIADTSLPDG